MPNPPSPTCKVSSQCRGVLEPVGLDNVLALVVCQNSSNASCVTEASDGGTLWVIGTCAGVSEPSPRDVDDSHAPGSSKGNAVEGAETFNPLLPRGGVALSAATAATKRRADHSNGGTSAVAPAGKDSTCDITIIWRFTT